MTFPEDKVSFICDWVEHSPDSRFHLIFPSTRERDAHNYVLYPQVTVLVASLSQDVLGRKIENAFLWSDIQYYKDGVQAELKYRAAICPNNFLYDLEQGEYIIDTAAKNS